MIYDRLRGVFVYGKEKGCKRHDIGTYSIARNSGFNRDAHPRHCSDSGSIRRTEAERNHAMKAKELRANLASQGIRLFALSLSTMAGSMTFIHSHKTTGEWRQDVRRFIDEIGHSKSRTGDAGDNALNTLLRKLSDAATSRSMMLCRKFMRGVFWRTPPALRTPPPS
jgi:hypothetical protein